MQFSNYTQKQKPIFIHTIINEYIYIPIDSLVRLVDQALALFELQFIGILLQNCVLLISRLA